MCLPRRVQDNLLSVHSGLALVELARDLFWGNSERESWQIRKISGDSKYGVTRVKNY